VKGRECEFGMCPEESPGRGSGSVPRNLVGKGGKSGGKLGSKVEGYLPAARASI
jgi:hypothetical protein